MWKKCKRAGIVMGALAALAGAPAYAKPVYKKALSEYFGPLLARKLDDCGTCHAVEGSDEPKFNLTLPKPHNAFGARLMAVAAELSKKGKGTDLPARLDAVAKEDSDGDGVSNVVELLTGHGPGSRKDRPTPAETAKAPKLLAALEKERRAYHWTPFEAVRRPAVPRVKNAAWVRNPIDAFIAAEWEKRGLQPRPEAPREVLLRRVYLDLIGLPPTREETETFLADHSPDAYERVVDRLLASPQYGERWGRHWMDVWRYSDWDGYGAEVRNSQPHIWRWRDWIISSLNEDKGYDRMVQEMLAGDELAPNDPNVLPATGFLVRNWYLFSRHETLNKVIEGTAKAFLGVTVNCARCHDHKFDPISQKDYYNLRAFFEPYDVRIDRVPGQPDTQKDGTARAFDANPDAPTFLFLKGDDRKPDKDQPAHAAVPAALGGPPLKLEPVALPLTASCPEKQEYVIRETIAASEQAVAKAREQMQTPGGSPGAQAQALAATEARHAALLATLRVEQLEDSGRKDTDAWKEAALQATAAQRRAALLEGTVNRLLAEAVLKGKEQEREKAAQAATENASLQPAAEKAAAELADARKKLSEAEAQAALAEKNAQLPPSTDYTKRAVKTYPAASTGRRLALARWITDPQNPLAARVAMNHLWLRHFGQALVPTVFDFGRNGQPPSHPALLDWLSSEFMAGDGGRKTEDGKGPSLVSRLPSPVSRWSFKRMHRLMVTSSAYRMDSAFDTASAAKDPDNRYLWRMNSRRMEAEVVRDSLLHLAGRLDLTRGGPELDQTLGLTSRRRSVYFRHSMEKQVEFLATFDQANVSECYARTESVVPQQALALANSSLALEQSRLLAGKLSKQVEGRPEPQATADFVSLAFLQILGRRPTTPERVQCETFLKEQAALLADGKKLTPVTTGAPAPVAPSADPAQRARESLVHVLFNHNDFVTIR